MTQLMHWPSRDVLMQYGETGGSRVRAAAFSKNPRYVYIAAESLKQVDVHNTSSTVLAEETGSTWVAISCSENLLAVSQDSIKIFNPDRPTEAIQILTDHTDTIYAHCFNRKGTYFASCGADKFINVYRTDDWTLPFHIDAGGRLYCIDFHPHDKDIVAVGGFGGFQKVFKLSTGLPVLDLDPTYAIGVNVWGIKFDHTGKRIVSGGLSHNANLFSAVDGTMLATFSGHQACINSLAFSPDDACIVTGAEDQTVKVWKTDSAELLHTFEVGSDVFVVNASPLRPWDLIPSLYARALLLARKRRGQLNMSKVPGHLQDEIAQTDD
eukprot:TRINITY_DN16945_c0_g1_i1.p1 TRINITY_DN16945_c0_g1~~TRINITY_DN16945_c0_g1_i1.p1  ORF type:complete len:362 (+),score=76.20 TRINITY_DN16945_c0_g1_i1:115-1086(+)